MRRSFQIVLILFMVKAFSLHAQTYSIGDIVTNGDGSKGIVFYVTEDRTDGWMVALNDLPTHNWGLSSDIPLLQNLDTPLTLLSETSGYDNTDIIRQFHASPGYTQTYGAGLVDFENEWYIPTAGQLQKLLSALSSINDIFAQVGGSTLQWQPYASSTEANTSGQIWAVDFGDHGRDWGGLFVSKSKSDDLCFRAVRNILDHAPLPEPTLPDNILDSDCNTPLEGFEWGIREDWSSGDNIYCRINPLVGDLDDDGIPEIVCFDMLGNSSSQTAAKTINVYDGRDKYLKAQINVEGLVWAHGNGPYGLVKLPHREGLIVTACKDSKLYAYNISLANSGVPVWVSNENYNTGYDDFSVSIGFADFNGDGHPEVYVRNKIFNGETGVLLATAQGGNNQADSYSHNSHTNHNKLSCPLAFDICGDTRQELILGNEIYDVVITNPNGTAGNRVTLTKSITPPNGIINDGHVQVADFNLDGHPDILISNRDAEGSTGTVPFYVWDVFNNRTSLPIQLETHFTGKSVPLIADFDHDGFVELLIDCCHENDKGLRAYRFNPATNGFSFLWSLPIDEDSYSNTATLFDFNADGKNELVYTDNRFLSIYDLSTTPPTELSKIDCGEISIMQVPIVADVDDDGSAEIIVTGKAGGYMQANTMLKVYKSSTEPWRPARKVWNQYMYHATNVNEDLTIPDFCFNTATVFTGPDGSIRRPFNNFLQQATYITQYGEPIGEMGEPQYVDIYDHLDGVYTWNGTTYTAPGEYTQQFTDIHGCDSIVTLHLSDDPIEFPDNILESDCNDNTPIPFHEGQLLHHTQNNINVYTTPLCGDIDNDGIVDIVVPHFTATDDNYRVWSNQIGIYNGNDLSLQSTISIPQEVYLLYHPYGIVRYPSESGGMQGAVFVLCNDGKLRSYSKNGQLLHTADVDPPCDGVPAFADFNNDGYPEVYIGNAIYDAATLKQLCVGPANGNKGLSYRGSPPTAFPHHANYALSFAYNIFGDEKLELVCGNTIYNVNIVSRTNPALNSITTNKTITPPNGFPQDGHASLADLDLDGEIDVVVTKDLTDDCVDDNTYFYAYKPSTGSILFHFSIYCRSAGLPVICNIDSDPHPEILYVDYLRDVYSEKMHCLRYTTGNGLEDIWAIHHNDPSGLTTMVFFDFNNDEIPEIVYRDAYALNIINGSDGSVLYSYPMRSGTACEHAIVADVNNDGHAEILATGLLEDYYGNNGHGSLNLFGHPEWSSARQVWNQYAYNVTNINNDLTVPQHSFDNASIFTDPDGMVRRPYNNFMYQATYILPTGEPYNPNGTVEVDIMGSGCRFFIFNGIRYDESGHYEQLIESETSCDTLFNIEVSLGGTVTYEWSQQGCGEFVWNGITYTEPGVYEQSFVTYDGCDSIVHLHLTFAGQPEAIPEIIGLTEVNVSTDLVVGQYFYHIDSVPLATHYEWELVGADWVMDPSGTSCSLIVTTPDTATLKVKAWNDCGYTEQQITIIAGFFDVDDNQTIPVSLYPNPSNDKVTLEAEGIKGVKIYDLQGQLLKKWIGEATDKVELSLQGFASALYTVEVLTERGRTILKMSVIH